MANNLASTRSALFFNQFPDENSGKIYSATLVIGAAFLGGFSYYISVLNEDKKYKEAQGYIWYLVINAIVAFGIYGYYRRKVDRNFRYGPLYLFALGFSPAFAIIELWDKIYLVFRKVFKGDQEEIDQTGLENFKQKMNKYRIFRSVDLDKSERFTYLFGNLSYDRQDSASIFRDGTDIVRTPVLVCSFFVSLCFLIPVVITAANGEKLTYETWEKNIAPVAAVISGLVLVFVLGTVQGYSADVSASRKKLLKNN